MFTLSARASTSSHPPSRWFQKRNRVGFYLFVVWRLLFGLHLTRLLRWLNGHNSVYPFLGELAVDVARECLDLDFGESEKVMRFTSSLQCRFLQSVISPVEAASPSARRLLKDSVWFGDADLTDSQLHVCVYIHGGGFCTGHARQWPGLFQQMIDGVRQKNGIRMRILSVEYPLATCSNEGTPSCTYGASPPQCAIEMVLAAFDFLVDEIGVPASRILLSGDSAGGNLALTSAIAMRDRINRRQQEGDGPSNARSPSSSPASLQLPCGLVLLSPWTDLSDRAHGFSDPACLALEANDMLSRPGFARFRRCVLGNVRNWRDQRKAAGQTLLYEGGGGGAPPMSMSALDASFSDATHWLVSPVYGDLRGLPAVHLTYSRTEVIAQDIAVMRQRLEEAGVDVRAHSQPAAQPMHQQLHLPHDYPTSTDAFGTPAHQAVDDIVRFMARQWRRK